MNEQNNTIIVVAYQDRGAGNDPKLFFFFLGAGVGEGWGGGSLSPPRLNISTVGNMGVMICLGQRGLCSLSAPSLVHLFILADVDHQYLTTSFLYYPRSLHKISAQSIHIFLSNVVHKQTKKQTNQLYQKHNPVFQLATLTKQENMPTF